MNKKLYWYVLLFVVSVLVQILIMNNMQFSGFINPYFYLLFILLLPINFPRYLLLLLGFVLGITIDVFSNTPGIHASSTVFIAFLRPYVINASNVEEQDRMMIPSVSNIGLGWFVRYAAIFIIIHHLFLFFVEIFTIQAFFNTLLRSLFSAIFTFVFILISQFLIFRK